MIAPVLDVVLGIGSISAIFVYASAPPRSKQRWLAKPSGRTEDPIQALPMITSSDPPP